MPRGKSEPFVEWLDRVAALRVRVALVHCGGNRDRAFASIGINKMMAYRILARDEKRILALIAARTNPLGGGGGEDAGDGRSDGARAGGVAGEFGGGAEADVGEGLV